MKSSYKENCYNNVFKALAFCIKPTKIVEFGILEAYFFGAEKKFKDGEIDILHIDIANNGDTYQHALDCYMQKVSLTGICILEGGSESRDNVYWMKQYNKPPIQPVLSNTENQQKYNILVLKDYPSITLITHKQGKI